jgi:hypothetical protein
MEWEADLPKNTWVKAQLRWANSAEEMEKADWNGPDGPDTWFEPMGGDLKRKPVCRFTQYRLAIGSSGSCSTPRIRKVQVNYSIQD